MSDIEKMLALEIAESLLLPFIPKKILKILELLRIIDDDYLVKKVIKRTYTIFDNARNNAKKCGKLLGLTLALGYPF
jgi:hypothetical protein